ncbi:MAG: UDP-N-acetylmuramoyl-L-alanine--D-glutamate ligase [Nitrospirae bacterium]|nr:UDP-N-acetylmuramoyl-L-alanine--D-glutamate ligase [Nitrospirota bacterium]
MEAKDKKVLIFGLGRSGIGAANLLAGAGAEVTVTDRKPAAELGEYLRSLSPSVGLCLGGYPGEVDGTDFVVVSPGVPMDIEPLVAVRKRAIPVLGELELAYRFLAEGKEGERKPAPPFLAVTGSNGKSTTTTLLDLMLRRAGFRTLLGGNIGNALTGEIIKGAEAQKSGSAEAEASGLPASLNSDFVVVEVSSFQLESIDRFKPGGAAILNITGDHLDRYHSMREYAEAKAAIFRNQDENDFLVLNADDPETTATYANFKTGRARFPRTFSFSRKEETQGVFLKEGRLYFHFPGLLHTPCKGEVIGAEEIRIRGVHNLENAMASAAMALLAGCSPDAVAEVLREFPGLEHRLEFVRELDGVRYINDSKGTNVGAVTKSLEGFSEPVHLIAGGRDKAGDFTQLRPLVKERVKTLILIGEAAEKMKKALGDLATTLFAPDLEEAVRTAKRAAKKGEVVLLSPACASFDMFRDFEDRGEQFKKIVGGLS